PSPPGRTRFPYTPLFRSPHLCDFGSALCFLEDPSYEGNDGHNKDDEYGGQGKAKRRRREREPAEPPYEDLKKRRARAHTHTHTRSEEHTSELQSRENLVC